LARNADRRCVDLVETRCRLAVVVLGPTDAVGYAKFFSRLHDAVIRVFDVADNVIEIHKYTRDFIDREWI